MMNGRKGLVISFGAVVIVLAVAAIIIGTKGSSSTQSATTMPPMGDTTASGTGSSSKASKAVATNAVTISSYMFSPMAITVKVGTTVTWTNQDDVRHSVVADSGSASGLNGPLIARGESYSFTFNKAGTFTYHCMPHPYMHGTVVVTN